VVDNAPDNDSTEKLVQRFPFARYVREPRKGLDIAAEHRCKNGIVRYYCLHR
jgi:hypothetical protein